MFKSFFSRKKPDEEPTNNNSENIEVSNINDNANMNIKEQIRWLEDTNWLEIHQKYYEDRINLLIMDDSAEIISSLIDDLETLNESNSINLDEYNIIAVSSRLAGFKVLEILKKAPDINIDYALLDIVLGGKKVVDGIRTMVDGVDIAIQLLKQYPEVEILFFSGCIIESVSNTSHFTTKFNDFTGDKLNDYMMPKDINFEKELKKLTNFLNGFSL